MRIDPKRYGVAIAALMGALLVSSGAHAFCRTTTTPPPVDPNQPNQTCWLEGKPLYHASQCLPYRLLAKESSVIPNAVLSAKLARAFSAWSASNPSCTPGITPIELAPTADSEIVGYTNGQPGRNTIGVPATWTHAGADETLSLATLTFDVNTGEVYDVDLEVNGQVAWSFAEAPPPESFDLESALTHEVGHMLGLAHSPLAEATMFASYLPGVVDARTLDTDDQQAVCAVYPNRDQRLAATGLVPSRACELTPGAADPSCADAAIIHGCATVPGESRGALLPALFVTLAAIATRRRSRGAHAR